jgi:hypothetical protein
MTYQLLFTNQASDDLDKLEQNPNLQKRLKAVRKALAYLETNPRHPSLKTHKYDSLSREIGTEVFEAYAENKTPVAYRIFWYYGPDKKKITVLAITPHP